MIYSSWGIQQNILKLVILGHFLSFYLLKTPKIKTSKNEKICWRYRHFTHVFQKPYSYDVRFLWYRARQIEFFVILGHFLSFYPTWWSQKSKLKRKKKNEKNAWGYYPFMHTCEPWMKIIWYIWFLKYKVRQTEIFVNLGHFWPFYPPTLFYTCVP